MAPAAVRTVLLFLPGLGSDHRLWHAQQSLPYTTNAPDYIDAFDNETLANYSKRFLRHLLDTHLISDGDDLVIIGASMGGAVAQELARHIKARSIILVGSLRSSKELRPLIRNFGRSIAKKLPIWLYRFSITLVPFVMRRLSAIPPNEVELCTLMYKDLSKHFFREGSRMLSEWEGCTTEIPTFRIHGANDHIIPFRRTSQIDLVIPEGKHLICLSHPEIVNRAINEFLHNTSIESV